MTTTDTARTAATYNPVFGVACPTCPAAVTDPCVGPSGRITRPHSARRDAALQHALGAAAPAAEAIAVDSAGTAQTPAAEPPVPTGPSTEELVLRLLVLKVLAGRIAEADADTRDSTVGRLDVGVSLPGYLTDEDRAAARAGERDRCLGKVGLSRPSESWKVTDVEKLTAFVTEHAPDEVEHKPVIRNSFLSALLASAKANGGTWTHPVTGEVLDLPGVELTLGRPTLQVRPSGDAEELVAEALALGLLAADGTRALPAGGAA